MDRFQRSRRGRTGLACALPRRSTEADLIVRVRGGGDCSHLPDVDAPRTTRRRIRACQEGPDWSAVETDRAASVETMELRFPGAPAGRDWRSALNPSTRGALSIESCRGSTHPGPGLRGWTHFAKYAEAAGMTPADLVRASAEPHPVAGRARPGHDEARFITAYRSGLISRRNFVRRSHALVPDPGTVAVNPLAAALRSSSRATAFSEH